mmetsp:Transcript_21514/g.68470  ORF Transcript_21514/g.68470 Transcript_21514/m.68470 type:complete len:233 (+) Transcript_21514:137-835(+)
MRDTHGAAAASCALLLARAPRRERRVRLCARLEHALRPATGEHLLDDGRGSIFHVLTRQPLRVRRCELKERWSCLGGECEPSCGQGTPRALLVALLVLLLLAVALLVLRFVAAVASHRRRELQRRRPRVSHCADENLFEERPRRPHANGLAVDVRRAEELAPGRDGDRRRRVLKRVPADERAGRHVDDAQRAIERRREDPARVSAPRDISERVRVPLELPHEPQRHRVHHAD